MGLNNTDLQQRRANYERLRRDATKNQGTLISYVNAAGEITAVQGDDEAPWVRSPSFVTDLQPYGTPDYQLPTTHASADAFFPLLNVQNFRKLCLGVWYIPGAVGGILSFIPFLDGYPESVAAAPVNLTPIGYGNDFTSRTLRSGEYRTAAAQVTAAIQFRVEIDVSAASYFYLTACEASTHTAGKVNFRTVLAM